MSNAKLIDLAYNLDPTTPVYPNYPLVAIEVLELGKVETRGGTPDLRKIERRDHLLR